MERLVERCAGLDMHKDKVVACVPGAGRRTAVVSGDADVQTTTAGAVDAAGLAA